MTVGFWQIALVVVLLVLLFGRGKISELMGDVAKGIKDFKKGMADTDADEKPGTAHTIGHDTEEPTSKTAARDEAVRS